MTAMAPQFAYILNRKLHPDSNVLRIHIQHIMKGSHTLEGSHASRMAQLRWYLYMQDNVTHSAGFCLLLQDNTA